MRRGQSVAQWLAVTMVLGCSAYMAAAATPAEDLDRARGLFRQGQYVESREVLLAIDRGQLSDEQKTRRDELAGELETAINQSTRARQNLEDAEQALKASDLPLAEKLYGAVQANNFATEAQKTRAREGLSLVERQRELQRQLDGKSPASQPASQPAGEESEPEPVASSRPAPSEAQIQRSRTGAANLIAEGDEALARGQYDVAADRFEAALRLVPNHPAALNGLQLVEQHRAVEGRSGGIESVQQAQHVRWQRAETLLRTAEQDVRANINAGRFEQAQVRLNEARQTLEAYRRDAEPADRATYWAGQLGALGRRIELEKQDVTAQRSREQEREARIQAQKQFVQDQKDRSERIAQLMEQAVQLQKERQYDKAVQVLNDVLLIDPLYDRAEFMKRVIEDANIIGLEKKSERKRRLKMGEQEMEAKDTITPDIVGYHGKVMLYPEEQEWRLVAKRDPFGSGISGESDSDRIARQKLASVISNVDLAEGTTFGDAIDNLKIIGKIDITVNWTALGTIAVEKGTDIGGSINLKDVKLQTILQFLLDNVGQAGGGAGQVAYDIIDGSIRISTQDDLNTRTVTKVYDIRDLLMRVRSFSNENGNNMMGGGMMGGMMGGMGGMGGMMGGMGGMGGMMGGMGGGMGGGYGGGGGGYGGGGGSGGGEEDDESEDRREEIIEDLEDLIMNNIEPGTWAPEGTQGSLDVWNDRMIVRHTPKVHREIMDLFRQLRALKDLQVAVEMRFITMESNFLEEIGVDLNVVLNQGNAGLDPAIDTNGAYVRDPNTGASLLQPRRFTQLGATPYGSPYGMPLAAGTTLGQPYQDVALVPQGQPGSWFSRHTTPIPIINNSLDLTQQLMGSRSTGVPGSLQALNQPAFQVFGSFLDNIQVDFLMRATQMDVHSSVVDSPRLVIFNGRGANLNVSTTTLFMISAGSQAVSGTGVGGQAAIGTNPTYLSAMRGRQLSVTPYVSADRKYVTLEIHPQFMDTRQQTFQSANGTIEKPESDMTSLDTYGTVPDGGTLLVGGLRQSGEVEVEAGVPVLSKLPALKRAFTNRSRVKDDRILLMLLKPKIIIQEEQEETAFPSLSVSDKANQ